MVKQYYNGGLESVVDFVTQNNPDNRYNIKVDYTTASSENDSQIMSDLRM